VLRVSVIYSSAVTPLGAIGTEGNPAFSSGCWCDGDLVTVSPAWTVWSCGLLVLSFVVARRGLRRP